MPFGILKNDMQIPVKNDLGRQKGLLDFFLFSFREQFLLHTQAAMSSWQSSYLNLPKTRVTGINQWEFEEAWGSQPMIFWAPAVLCTRPACGSLHCITVPFPEIHKGEAYI